MLGPMEPIFAVEATRLVRHDPIGRVSRAPGDHADPEAVQPVLPATLDPHPHHLPHPPGELLTMGPLGDAYEDLDGQLHPLHPEEAP